MTEPGIFSNRQLSRWSNSRLIAIMRNDAHRIEKSYYSKRISDNLVYYKKKLTQIERIFSILSRRGFSLDEPTVVWAKMICDHFHDLDQKFINPGKRQAATFSPDQAEEFLEFLKARRSTRVWSLDQPREAELLDIAHKMIDAARWAPSSGNRQAWRFVVLYAPEDKNLLNPIKEVHCYRAPLAIFVGMDVDSFVFENTNICMYVDAGMAMMSMVLIAHKCGLGTVVNHFGMDLIKSRRANKVAYRKFTRKFDIPDNIAPVAIVNIGLPEFIPPVPSRAEIASLLLH